MALEAHFGKRDRRLRDRRCRGDDVASDGIGMLRGYVGNGHVAGIIQNPARREQSNAVVRERLRVFEGDRPVTDAPKKIEHIAWPFRCGPMPCAATDEKVDRGFRSGTGKPVDIMVDGDDRTAEIVVPRQPIPQTIGHTQHPLPNRDIGEDVVRRPAPPSAGCHNSDRTRGPCMRRPPAGHGRTPHSETARIRRPTSHNGGNHETPAPRIGAGLPHRGDSRSPHETSRSDRGPPGRAHSAQGAAARTSRTNGSPGL